MKKQAFRPAGILLLLSLPFMGCKKENSAKNVNSTFFENTIWIGDFDAPEGSHLPVSIEFKKDGMVAWYDVSGESLGSWNVENNMVNVSIAGEGTFRANVSGDNRLTGIQKSSDIKWTAISVKLDTIPPPDLTGTTWEGANDIIHFSDNGVLNLQIGSSTFHTAYYERKAKTIRFVLYTSSPWQWFFLNNDTAVMKGVNQFVGETIYPCPIVKK